MSEHETRSMEQKKKEAKSREWDQQERDQERATGFGSKKLEGPDRPST
ncbi:hypothetical protein ACFO25_17820 [Paenactinomyces guangxiensis]|uniref:Uncharacterized protein n=1 Tax=Paenactinomyces guangxiensis TaxID=1490290 RepID=A0A7W1WRK5_9BACL|nr:hypothetical protein [Paenactinomyces guangxiensis]MBA4494677.1 hypothetical protein [Paenactinomyces guangxiensis]MBH8591761.1 hypothetical protein [Paenactinomyces guangxiensis]